MRQVSIPQPTSHIPYTRIGIRLGLCTHSNRLDRRSILHANAPLQAGSRGATSCRLTSRARPTRGGGGSEFGGLVFLACACVFCLLRFRVGLGAVWASGCCVGFEVEVELSDTQSRPYHKAKKKDNDIVFFPLPPHPPLSCPAP